MKNIFGEFFSGKNLLKNLSTKRSYAMRRGNGKRYTRFPVKINEFESASFLQELPQIVCPKG
jgi:hypothetical protein